MVNNISAYDTPVILVFGDSLSAGYGIDIEDSWPTLLQKQLDNENYEYQVINTSISGETTEGGINRIEIALKTFNPELLILELGGNDGLRGFPPKLIKANLERIINTCKNNGTNVVLLGIRIPMNYGQRYTRTFEKIYREIAHELSVPWIAFFMDGVAQNSNLMQNDGIHPNAAAQPKLLENIWPAIQSIINKEKTLTTQLRE